MNQTWKMGGKKLVSGLILAHLVQVLAAKKKKKKSSLKSAHFITVLVLHGRNFSITSADQLHQKIKSRWNSALLDKVVHELLY